MAKQSRHQWRFQRLGGFDQVTLETAEDLKNLGEFDQKLWAALACPTKGVEFDERTLAFLDTDGDGRIRVPELRDAIAWACGLLKNPAELLQPTEGLPLKSIDDSTEDGARLRASAEQILTNLGKGDAASITPEETADTSRIFADTAFNGDGVVPASSAEDEAVAAAIEEIIGCVGGVPDRCGADGIDGEHLEQFFSEAQAFADWWGEGEASNVRLLGDKTDAAADALEAVQEKIEDFFTRARLAAFDERAAAVVNPSEADFAAVTAQTLSPDTEALATFPLARAESDRALPLAAGLNPGWAAALTKFRDEVVVPLLGEQSELTEEAWRDISGRFAAYAGWRAEQRGDIVAGLGMERIKALLEGSTRADIEALLAKDLEVAPEADGIEAVNKLVHYYQHLDTLLHNFVSLRDFYSLDHKAVFQAGTLYLDGRSCDLCVKVDNVAKHAAMATRSNTYLAYCECRRRGGAEKMTIAAAFTGGDSDNLMVGRNGVFYDRDGGDWDATITKLVEHPISLSQAFWSPYKRFARMISDQIEKMAGAQDKAVTASASKGIAGAADSASSGKPAAPAFDIAKFAGIFAAIGLAVGAIGTALAAVVTGFLGLAWWQMPLAIVGIMLVISGPSMVLAYMKLRQRNLAPMLDANGWAVNTRAKINIPFGATLTQTAELPDGAKRSMRDPFAKKASIWPWVIALVILAGGAGAAWQFGWVDKAMSLLNGGDAPAAEEVASEDDAA
ncbi:MAG: hypothetical protein AAF184_18105 [Pseudomonadota bacterium]